jgi:16S rRNA (adenine1518-N6/adenine1519-N6)-dimethyltransferase
MDEHPRARRHDIGEAMRNVRTKRQLVELFRYLGIRPTRRLGQNFLVDHNLLDYIVRAAEVGPGDLVLDIGSGTGLLTAHLADAAGQVIAIEKDRRVHAIASRTLEDRPNVTLLLGDALESKHALSAELLDAVRDEWSGGHYAALRVVANLPYAAASLILPNLLESGLPVAAVVVTVQKEVAERIAAEPGSSDYGALSVIVQAHARAQVLRAVPPNVFWPQPKVQSAILRLDPEAERRERIADYATFAAVVRAAFRHRRKTLLNALDSAAGHFGFAQYRNEGRPALDTLLAEAGLDPSRRPEQVSLEQYIALANAIASQPDADSP